jgi:hypothetical protein
VVDFLTKFRVSEDGAVTVDWVVLTAAVVGLAVAAMTSIYTPTANVGDGVGTFLTDSDSGNF